MFNLGFLFGSLKRCFICRNHCNCLLTAIDKANDILMFVLPPNLQNYSLLETMPHRSVLFPLHPQRFFYFFSFVVIIQHVVNDIGHLLLSCCFWHSWVTYTHMHTLVIAQRRYYLTALCMFLYNTLVNVCVIRRKKCKNLPCDHRENSFPLSSVLSRGNNFPSSDFKLFPYFLSSIILEEFFILCF